MKNAKKFTCLNDKGEKIDGAIEGAKGKVLAWMKKTFPGVRKAMPQEMVPAWVFFHIGEIEDYETTDGKKVYLAEAMDEVMEEKRRERDLEVSLRNYRRHLAKTHSGIAQKLAKGAMMKDEEVAEEAAKAIWETAHLNPQAQAEKLFSKYTFWWVSPEDQWSISDMAIRLVHNEDAAKQLLCSRFIQPNFRKDDDNGDILATRVREGRFVHFQITRSFTGGTDAYVVFRTPKTRDAVIIRFCYG